MLGTFDLSRVLILYLVWHYTQALHDLFSLIADGFRFIIHFFSIRLLTRTFFAPWRRLHEEAPKGIAHVADFLAAKTVNTIMRCVGILVRASVLLMGLATLASFLCLSIVLFFCWLFLPLSVGALVMTGFSYLSGIF